LLNDTVTDYIRRTRGWNPSDYRIESRGPSADGRSDIFAVIHRSDESGSHPGAGLSFELYVDRASNQVKKEMGGQ
jgi:hypothetical protein